MKVLIHIGTEKTGTTLLQEWLYTNRQILSDSGIFLSDCLGKPNNRHLVAYFQKCLDDWTLSKRIRNHDEKKAYFEGFEETFSSEIKHAAQGHGTFLITSEHFHSRLCSGDEIRALREFLGKYFSEFGIICYFREQFEMAKSLYSTAVRRAMEKDQNEFFDGVSPDNYYFNFKQISDNWSTVFGKDACNFRIYDRRKFEGGDIRTDFLSCLNSGLDTEQLNFGHESSNESLSEFQIALFRAINIKIPFFWDRGVQTVNPRNQALKRAILSMSTVGTEGDSSVPNNRQAAVRSRFSEVNNDFFVTHFNGRYEFPDPHNTPDEIHDSKFTANDVAAILSELLNVLVDFSEPEKVLSHSDADCLRDIALKYETQADLSAQEAATLMGLARRARPEGTLVASKHEEYKVKAIRGNG